MEDYIEPVVRNEEYLELFNDLITSNQRLVQQNMIAPLRWFERKVNRALLVHMVLCNFLLPLIVFINQSCSSLSRESFFLEEFSPFHMAIFFSCAVFGTYFGANLIIETYRE